MTLKAQLGVSFVEGSLTLNVGEWYWIYVSYTCAAGNIAASIVYVNGASIDLSIYVAGALPSSKLSSSDVVQFGGGFTGKLRRAQVYSPAAFALNPGPLFNLFLSF